MEVKMKLPKRLDRRDRTWRKCLRRARLQYLRGIFWSGPGLDPEPHRNHKRGVNCHPCGKRRKGRPKYGYGICHAFDVRLAVVERKRGKRLCREALRENWDYTGSRQAPNYPRRSDMEKDTDFRKVMRRG